MPPIRRTPNSNPRSVPMRTRILQTGWVAGLLAAALFASLAVVNLNRTVPHEQYGFPPVELVVSDQNGEAKPTGIYALAVPLADEPVWKYVLAQALPIAPWLFSKEAFSSGAGDALQESARLSGWYAASKITGRPVSVGVLISNGAPPPLQDGDVVLRVNDNPAVGTNTVRSALAERNCPDGKVRVKVQRGDQRVTMQMPCPTSMDNAELVIVGAEQPPWEVPVLDGVKGPSTGLALALAYIDSMEPGSLSGGKSIAATGKVLPRTGQDAGLVLEVGSIEAKMQAARTAHVDVILVPKTQERTARLHAGTTPVVGVRTVREAVLYLCATGATSEVCSQLEPEAS